MPSYLSDKADFSMVRQVLVIKLQHLGDVLLTSPLFAVLKQRHPHLEIDALIFADTLPMLSDNPHVNRIFTLQRNSPHSPERTIWGRAAQEYRLHQELKARRYDLIIALSDRLRAAWLTRLLRPTYSVAQKYPYKRGAFWRNSFTHLYSIPATPRHTVEIHLDALRRLGIYPQGEEKRLHIGINPAAEEKVTALLTERQLTAGQYIVVHPSSRWMFKSWHPTRFAEVLRQLAASGFPLVLVSGPEQAERNYAHTILEQTSANVADLSGQLTLQELACLIRHSRCFIGLDSVAMHLAAAVETPCAALFGPSDERIWRPWMAPHRVIASDHACRPCNMDGCGNGKVSDCLQAIDARTVYDAVNDLISETTS
jgi:heptosyltransferase-3